METIDELKRALERERAAREAAEATLERRVGERVRAVEERYRSIVENMALGLMEVDREGRILRVYERFCAMTGYRPKELVGRSAVEVFLPPESLADLQVVPGDRDRHGPEVYETRIRCKDGSLLWVLIGGAPLYDEQGEISGSIGIHLDLSPQKELQQKLQEARSLAERAQEAEKQFLANMSHEIRTPLNAIIGMAHLLQDTDPNEEQREYLGMLKSSAEMLQALISDILDISKIRSGKFELRAKPFDLHGLVSALDKNFRYRSEGKPVEVRSQVDADLKHLVLGDELLLQQILVNLLGNAEKFTEQGEFGLNVRLIDRNEGQVRIEFNVFDTGVGIAEEDQEKIFGSFQQGKNIGAAGYAGTGLGLAITRELIALQGGNIRVDSRPGEGARFTFRLSYQESETLRGDQAAAVQSVPDLDAGGLSVLVVEDNVMNRKYITTLFKRWNATYTVASDGREALRLAAEHPFDLILMDIGLPGISGLQTTRMLRRLEGPNRDAPIVALTASALSSERDEAYDAGVNGLLTKPFIPAQLREALVQHARGIAAAHFPAAPNSRLVHPETQASGPAIRSDENDQLDTVVRHTVFAPKAGSVSFSVRLDVSALEELYGDDADYAAEMFETFLGHTLAEFEEFKPLFDARDWDGLRRLAHKLKPGCAMVGLTGLQHKLETLEQRSSDSPEPDTICELLQQVEADLKDNLPAVKEQFEALKSRAA